MRLRTLGRLELEGSGLNRPKPLLLLCYLALEGAQERRHLAELFWPTSTNALKSLSMALTRLRQGAPGVAEADQVEVRAEIASDVEELQQALEQKHYQQVIELYQGPFLQGFPPQELGPELEEWLYHTREKLASQVREALLRSAEAQAAKGELAAAAEHAAEAYALRGAPPLEPPELEQLYTLLRAADSAVAAEVAAEAEEFGLTVAVSVEEARARLELPTDDAPPIPNNLPAQVSSFVGRELELAELSGMLEQGDCRLITITGQGGTGKSQLALQLARKHLDARRFADGVYFVALEDVTGAASVPTRIAEVIQAEPQRRRTQAERAPSGTNQTMDMLIEHIDQRPMLLVLDNYEHLIDAALLTSELLSNCPNLKLVATSRERLNVSEEWAFPLEGLLYPNEATTPLQEALAFDAIKLFVSRAERARPSFTLTEETLIPVVESCRLVMGSPLAIELAAAWVRGLTPKDIASEIKGSLDFLAGTTRNLPGRHRSIRAVFEHSWRLLSEGEQQVFRQLAVFQAGFTHTAAKEVAGASLSTLVGLVDKSLLRLDSRRGRYDRHPLLYEYAREKLAEHKAEASAARARHGRYFLGLLADFPAEEVHDNNKEKPVRALARELGNVVAAWHWGTESHEFALLNDAFLTTFELFNVVNENAQTTEIWSTALAALGESDSDHPLLLGRLLIGLGGTSVDIDDYDRAHSALQRGVNLLEPLGDKAGLWRGLQLLSFTFASCGDFAEAKRCTEKALALALDHPMYRLVSYRYQGDFEMHLGNYAAAEEQLRRALALFDRTGIDIEVPETLRALGNLCLLRDDPREARSYFARALDLISHDSERYSPDLEAFFLDRLGLCAHLLADYPAARALLARGLAKRREAIALEEAEPFELAPLHNLLGLVAAAAGDVGGARASLAEALRLGLRAPDYALGIVNHSLVVAADLKLQLGETEGAIELLGLALRGRGLGNPGTDKLADQHLAEKVLERAKAGLSDQGFEAALERGQSLEPRETARLLLEELERELPVSKAMGGGSYEGIG
jgi:predicted ATPase/DNA-binding SARP family transcriptional activator